MKYDKVYYCSCYAVVKNFKYMASIKRIGYFIFSFVWV